jgi:hypothetical protein
MIYENIVNILNNLKIKFDSIDHEPTTSCEHSKELREKA